MKHNSLKTGGSIASQHVMSGFKQGCGANFANEAKVQFNVREIVNNYGSEYKTTGGAKRQNKRQQGGDFDENVEQFLEKVVDNRVLDLYLKYLGITLLTPATLVPIALIMGKNVFEQVVKDIKANDKEIQQGGEGFLNVDIPILDDEIVGTGLKLAGITALTVSPYTLVPLAVIMYIYTLFESEKLQLGGYQNNLDTPASRNDAFGQNSQPVQQNDIVFPFQKGGLDKISFGNTSDYGHCRQPNLDWTDKGNTFAYKGGKKSRKNNKQLGGTRYFLGADVPINPLQTADAIWNGEPWTATRFVDYVNPELQLRTDSMGIPPQPTYRAPYYQDTHVIVQEPTAASCGMTESCASVINSMAGGASSDWRSTVYSAGPVNQPPMTPEQLALFNNSQN
jgi:hypothetical protein